MIEFMECPSCGKSIRSDATQCHRCGRSLADEFSDETQWGCPEHADGGYDSAEDIEESDEETSSSDTPGMFGITGRLWAFVAWMMVFVFLLPFVLHAIEIFLGPV
jgi:hypothetical protein